MTTAEVSVSDGSAFRVDSFYQTPATSAVRHVDEGERWVVSEGPIGWTRSGDKAETGGAFLKTFALGHQYHALLWHFAEITNNNRQRDDIRFEGRPHSGITGDWPHGGTVHMVFDGEREPRALVFEFPDAPRITTTFSEWRDSGSARTPFRARIDDGNRIFDYRYTRVDVGSPSPLWFYDAVPSPGVDELDVYRLHRRLLAAHCLGDASLIAALSSPTVLVASRGSLSRTDPASMTTRFESLFEMLDYREYHDLVEPEITVADSGDIAWVGVNVRAVGNAIATGDPFDNQWAWIMLARKIDGQWRHAGNASNVRASD